MGNNPVAFVGSLTAVVANCLKHSPVLISSPSQLYGKCSRLKQFARTHAQFTKNKEGKILISALKFTRRTLVKLHLQSANSSNYRKIALSHKHCFKKLLFAVDFSTLHSTLQKLSKHTYFIFVSICFTELIQCSCFLYACYITNCLAINLC